MVSPALTTLVQEHAPYQPYCGPNKYARVRSKEVALGEPYIQLNPPAFRAWLILDIDKPNAAFACEDNGLPTPTFVAINPDNGHAHAGYALSTPVCVTDAARIAPIRYLAAIEHAYTMQAGADVAFTGPLSKNPLHPRWRVMEPANAPAYELGYLADFVDLPNRLPPRPSGVGRNCDLFDCLRQWAYRAVRDYWGPGRQDIWREAVRRHAEALNTFLVPLGNAEVAGIARSVARHVWRNTTPTSFHESQVAKGKRGAAVAAQVKRERREQVVLDVIARLSVGDWMPSMRTVAKEVGCSVSTLSEGYGHLWTLPD